MRLPVLTLSVFAAACSGETSEPALIDSAINDTNASQDTAVAETTTTDDSVAMDSVAMDSATLDAVAVEDTSSDAACMPSGPAPANDACSAASYISSDSLSATGTTVGALGDGKGSCGSRGGDVNFYFTKPATVGMVKVTVTPTSSPDFIPVVGIYAYGCSGGDAKACSTASGPGMTVNATATGLYFPGDGPSYYYIVVGSSSCTGGSFKLTISM